MQEIWINLGRSDKARRPSTIIEISNTGLFKRLDGTIGVIPLRMQIGTPPKLVYRILMEYFKPKTEEDIRLGRDIIDHVSYEPVDMNINDIRNLRWCTQKENNNFDEHLHNLSTALKGKSKSKPVWNKGKKGLQVAWNKGKHRKVIDGRHVYY